MPSPPAPKNRKIAVVPEEGVRFYSYPAAPAGWVAVPPMIPQMATAFYPTMPAELVSPGFAAPFPMEMAAASTAAWRTWQPDSAAVPSTPTEPPRTLPKPPPTLPSINAVIGTPAPFQASNLPPPATSVGASSRRSKPGAKASASSSASSSGQPSPPSSSSSAPAGAGASSSTRTRGTRRRRSPTSK